MKLQERSYSSQLFRPKPVIHAESDGSLLVVATSWGEPEHANKAIEEVVKYVTAARGDVEVTSPFEFMTVLSDQANYLRIGVLIANDMLYRAENKAEYVSGVELLVLSHQGSQLAWAQVGAPHVLLQRKSRPVSPLAVCYDHSFEIGLRGEKSVAPLPSHMAGLDPSCNIVSGDLQVQEGDRLVLLSSSQLPSSLWTSQSSSDLQSITKSMIEVDADQPFWLGLVDIE